MSRLGPQSPTCGTMPFEGRYHEILYCDSVCDSNTISIFWDLPQNAFDYQNKQSLNLILSLFQNQSQGSLFNCLKTLNYASEMDSDDVISISTVFKCVNLQITLTEEGLQNYKKVLALLFEFRRKIEEEWLAEGKVLDVW